MPDPGQFAARAAAALGFSGGRRFLNSAGELGLFAGSERGDLLVAHVGRGAAGGPADALFWADEVVRELWERPGTREEMMLCVIVGQDAEPGKVNTGTGVG